LNLEPAPTVGPKILEFTGSATAGSVTLSMKCDQPGLGLYAMSITKFVEKTNGHSTI